MMHGHLNVKCLRLYIWFYHSVLWKAES